LFHGDDMAERIDDLAVVDLPHLLGQLSTGIRS
jgi:hypothetical protein